MSRSLDKIEWNGVVFNRMGSGSNSVVFSDKHNTCVIKIPHKQRTLSDEIEMLNMYCQLAPEYSPCPVATIKLDNGPFYGILMKNVGPCLYDAREFLQVHEKIYLMMQMTDIILCISDNLGISDFHSENICVFQRGAMIRLKLIDCLAWDSEKDFTILTWKQNLYLIKRLWMDIYPKYDALSRYEKNTADKINVLLYGWHNIIDKFKNNHFKMRKEFIKWILNLSHQMMIILISRNDPIFNQEIAEFMLKIRERGTFMIQKYIEREEAEIP